MKKVIMLAAVVAALVSCQSKGTKAEEAVADSLAVAMEPTMEETQVYEGVLPAADGPGIRYVLTLNTLANATDTTYTLDVTYLDAEGKGKDKTFTSKGKPVKVEKTVKDKKKTAIKLNPSDGSEPVYFVIANYFVSFSKYGKRSRGTSIVIVRGPLNTLPRSSFHLPFGNITVRLVPDVSIGATRYLSPSINWSLQSMNPW